MPPFISLFELFSNRFFRIPDYQRGYAWSDEQRKDFWEDLINLPDNHDHFTGTIAIKQMSPGDFPVNSYEQYVLQQDNNIAAYQVIDGQQRLTTAIILLNELLRFFERSNLRVINNIHLEEYKRRFVYRPVANDDGYCALAYSADNEASRFLLHVIFGIGNAAGDNGLQTAYTRNLADAKVFFRRNIDSLHEEGGMTAMQDMFLKLIHRIKFNYIQFAAEEDVNVAFETMNNRGRPLSNLELLKNRLLYLVELFDENVLIRPVREDLHAQINRCWRRIYEQLGHNENKVLADDDFLRAHWYVYFKYSRGRGDDYIEFLLKEQFVASKVTAHLHHAVDVQQAAEVLHDDHELVEDQLPESQNGEDAAVRPLTPNLIRDYVESLARFSNYWRMSFFPVAQDHISQDVIDGLERLNHVGTQTFRPLIAAVLEHDIQNERLLVEFLDKLEKFIFKVFCMGYANTSKGASELLGLGRRYYRREPGYSLQDILASEQWVNILTNVNFVEKFMQKIHDLQEKGSGFYEWRGIKHFLFEYNAWRSRQLHVNDGGLRWGGYSRPAADQISIEHILPQSPNDWYWRNQFRGFLDNPRERSLLIGALGNLLPLRLTINIRLQNDPFPLKKEGRPAEEGVENGHGGYIYGCTAERDVGNVPDWTPEQIFARSHQLIDCLRVRWEVDISPEQEAELLALEFLHDGRQIPEPLPQEDNAQPMINNHGPNAINDPPARRILPRYDVGVVGGSSIEYGTRLFMGAAAIATVRGYVLTHPNVTFAELRAAFPRECHGGYEVVRLANDPEAQRHNNYALGEADQITLANGDRVAVVNQWAGAGDAANWHRFVVRAHDNGISITQNIAPQQVVNNHHHNHQEATRVRREELEQRLEVDTDGLKQIVSDAIRQAGAALNGRLVCKPNGRVLSFTSRAIATFLGNHKAHQFFFGIGHPDDWFCIGADLRVAGVAVPEKNALMRAVGEIDEEITARTGFRQFWHSYLTVDDEVFSVEALTDWIVTRIVSVFDLEDQWLEDARAIIDGANG